jgi:alpha-D-xyloside xylohydrolase
MVKFFKKKDSSLIFRENGELVMVTPWGEDSIRVRSTFLGEISDKSAALLEALGTTSTIEIHDKTATLQNGRISVKMEVDNWGNSLQMTFYNQAGKILLQEIPNGGALQKKARNFTPLSGDNYHIRASFVSNPDEKIYGMGQYQQEILNLKGCNLELAHRNSQASIPFYMSSIGYGFLWNNPSIGEVHFGTNTTEWVAQNSEQLDYWITAGDTPAQIEEAYARATGTVPMMPEYGMGFWQCKLRYYNEQQVLDIAREYKKRNIPLDVLVIDYYHWPRCGDWRFDEEYFPNPENMIKEIQDMGIKVMVSVWPQVDWRSENYNELKQQGMLIKIHSGVDIQMTYNGNNVFIDTTNPRTRKYVWDKCKKNYADLGIRTFWLDEAEPEFATYDYSNYRLYEGELTKVGNVYPREYARLFYEGQKANGQEDIVNLIRCAWVGSQRYGALVWSGDIMSNFADFRKQICVGIHMGISGIPWWTTDIGGFHGGNINDEGFKELLIRWFQFGTFCPVMRLHGHRSPMQKIVDKKGEAREGTGAENEVWSYGDDNYEIMVKFIRIREMMRPYIREIMKEAHEKGTPVIRAMFYVFPEDKVCWDIKDQYMFGPDLLVAPVCHEKETSRSVYLPKGEKFVHASTGKSYEGGQWYEVEAPIDTIPIFLRNGRQEYLIGKI